MPTIPNRFNFEPRKNTLKLWLGCRREPKYCGTVVLPGLFQDIRQDTLWAILAILIELVAFTITIHGGIDRGDIFLPGSFVVVLLFILFDIVGVYFLHQRIILVTKWENENLIHTALNQSDLPLAHPMLNASNRLINIAGWVLLFLSFILKFTAVLITGRITQTMVYVILFIFFLLIIYIHSNHTGYFFYELLCQLKINREYKKLLESVDKTDNKNKSQKGDLQAQPRQLPFQTDKKLNEPMISGEHRIEEIINIGDKDNNIKKNIYNYRLITIGILLDDDIMSLIQAQIHSDMKGLIALQCLKLQIEQFL